MLIEIDTVSKQIKVKGIASLKELFNFLMNRFPEFEWEQYSITEYPLPDLKWYPGSTGTGIFPINPNPVIPYSPLINPQPYTNPYIGDDPNKWGTVIGGLTGTIDLNGGMGSATVKSSLDQS